MERNYKNTIHKMANLTNDQLNALYADIVEGYIYFLEPELKTIQRADGSRPMKEINEILDTARMLIKRHTEWSYLYQSFLRHFPQRHPVTDNTELVTIYKSLTTDEFNSFIRFAIIYFLDKFRNSLDKRYTARAKKRYLPSYELSLDTIKHLLITARISYYLFMGVPLTVEQPDNKDEGLEDIIIDNINELNNKYKIEPYDD